MKRKVSTPAALATAISVWDDESLWSEGMIVRGYVCAGLRQHAQTEAYKKYGMASWLTSARFFSLLDISIFKMSDLFDEVKMVSLKHCKRYWLGKSRYQKPGNKGSMRMGFTGCGSVY